MSEKQGCGWEPDEDAVLRQYWGTLALIEDIAAKLPGRTVAAIRGRASKIGLLRPKESGWRDRRARSSAQNKAAARAAVMGPRPAPLDSGVLPLSASVPKERVGWRPEGGRHEGRPRVSEEERRQIEDHLATKGVSRCQTATLHGPCLPPSPARRY